jgi:hypothetical protein
MPYAYLLRNVVAHCTLLCRVFSEMLVIQRCSTVQFIFYMLSLHSNSVLQA